MLSLVNNSNLNAMVIDIKDDRGYLTFTPSKNSSYFLGQVDHILPILRQLMNTLRTNHIYPIPRIVIFKVIMSYHSRNPSLSFKSPN